MIKAQTITKARDATHILLLTLVAIGASTHVNAACQAIFCGAGAGCGPTCYCGICSDNANYCCYANDVCSIYCNPNLGAGCGTKCFCGLAATRDYYVCYSNSLLGRSENTTWSKHEIAQREAILTHNSGFLSKFRIGHEAVQSFTPGREPEEL